MGKNDSRRVRFGVPGKLDSERQYLSDVERAMAEERAAERALRATARRPSDPRPRSPESSYTYDYEDYEEEIPEIEDEEPDQFAKRLPPTRHWKEVSSKDRGVAGAVGPASPKEKKKDRGASGAVGPTGPKEKKKEKGLGPQNWVELETEAC